MAAAMVALGWLGMVIHHLLAMSVQALLAPHAGDALCGCGGSTVHNVICIAERSSIQTPSPHAMLSLCFLFLSCITGKQ